jgi:predicted DNA-binding transcriptional regulator
MSKDQTLGVGIFILCAFIAICFVSLLFFYDPYIVSFLNIGATADVHYWLIATPVAVAFIGIMAIGAWIGWTMATTPPPKPIEEIDGEKEDNSASA